MAKEWLRFWSIRFCERKRCGCCFCVFFFFWVKYSINHDFRMKSQLNCLFVQNSHCSRIMQTLQRHKIWLDAIILSCFCFMDFKIMAKDFGWFSFQCNVFRYCYPIHIETRINGKCDWRWIQNRDDSIEMQPPSKIKANIMENMEGWRMIKWMNKWAHQRSFDVTAPLLLLLPHTTTECLWAHSKASVHSPNGHPIARVNWDGVWRHYMLIVANRSMKRGHFMDRKPEYRNWIAVCKHCTDNKPLNMYIYALISPG